MRSDTRTALAADDEAMLQTAVRVVALRFFIGAAAR